MPFLLFRIVLLSLGLNHAVSASPPQVVASIAPIHALASAIMQGVAEPELLIRANTSPHHFHLRPSQLASLQSADLFLWVSPTLEQGIAKIIAQPDIQDKTLTLIDQTGIKKLDARKAGIWHDNDKHHHAHLDPHIWLSPDNAIIIASSIAKRLSIIDSGNAERFGQNLDLFKKDVRKIEQDIISQLKQKKVPPYLVLHDAFQYFENHFNLPAAGAVSIGPEHRPGARRLQILRNYIRDNRVDCLFREPQLSDRLLNSISQGIKLKSGTLDPIGNEGDSYIQLLKSLSQQLGNCHSISE